MVGVDDGLTAQAIAEALESLPTPYRFEVTPLTGETYPPLAGHIQRTGITIYMKDAHAHRKDEAFDALATAELTALGKDRC